MRILILALGSRGDVLPYAALGQGLQAAGHHVRLATFENFAPLVSAIGLDFFPICGDAQSILQSSSGKSLTSSGRNVFRMWAGVMKTFGVLAESISRDLSSPLLADTQAIINQLPAALYGYDLAEKLSIPMFQAGVIPLARTRAFPMHGFPLVFNSIPGYNVLSYRIAEQMAWQGFRPAINRWRQKTLGLPKLPLRGTFDELSRRRVPILYGFSAHVVPRPADWGDHIHLTGYWFPEEKPWQPSEDLERFLDSGPPPVFIGFGSMPVHDLRRVTSTILEALKRCGQRAILQPGWSGTSSISLPDSVMSVGELPYQWLLPRMAAVIHHGGSGTTASGLRAGLPTLIVPFGFDQFYWGSRVHSLGVGPAPIPYRKLSAESLASAVTEAVSDPGMKQHAEAVGAKIRAEDGVKAAVAVLQRYL